MIESIWSGLTRLHVFSGRDSRSAFWPYAIFAVIAAAAVGAVIIVPIFAAAFARIQKFAAEHPDQVTIHASPGGYSINVHGQHQGLMPDFDAFFGGVALVAVLSVALLAAAVARRLHDTGRTALWGLPPVIFIVIALVGFPRLMAGFQAGQPPALGLFFALFFNNVAYLGALGLLGVFLASASASRGDRFGPTR